MIRRDDIQFCLMATGLAAFLWVCDWGITRAFESWADRVQESVSVEIHGEGANHLVPPSYGMSNEERRKRCKRDSECSKLAEALVYEARGESLQGAVAVGYVIIERTKNPDRWANTIKGVVSEKCQFSYTCWKQRKKARDEDWERAYITSYEIINGEVENPIGTSDHYHTTKVNPWWAKKMQYVATVGNHVFYKEM
jgi:spore germination cell wall hydrolase CwlJ-like protein